MTLFPKTALFTLPLLAYSLFAGAAQDTSAPAEAPAEAPAPKVDVVIDMKPALIEGVAPFVVERGVGEPDLLVPRGEHLGFGVHVALGPIGATVGSVDLDSGVEAYQQGLVLMVPNPEGKGKETAWLRAKAKGSYMWYDMKTVLDSRYLPKVWPSISHMYRQSGSENRRRESLFGVLDGKSQTSYRRDTSKGAPSGEQIWKPAEFRDIPVGSVDMLGAVYLSRTLLLSGQEEIVFPLLDKTTLWELTLRRGDKGIVEVPAGRFDAIEVILDPKPYPGEPDKDKEKFEGLFGIRGSIHLWVDVLTGVPVRITGTIPAGPVEIDVDIFLEVFEGTPDLFLPLPELKDD